MDAFQALKEVFIFKDVPDNVLRLVAGAAEEISLSAGNTVVSRADEPNALFVIQTGTVQVVPEAPGSTPIQFGSGETLGEVPFIDGGPAGITAVALERLDLLMIRSKKLEAILAANPDAGRQFYHAIAVSLAKRMRRLVGMMAFAREREARS